MAEVFSIHKFKLDRRVVCFQRIRALISGWPQACDGRPIVELQKTYKILPEWIDDNKKEPVER